MRKKFSASLIACALLLLLLVIPISLTHPQQSLESRTYYIWYTLAGGYWIRALQRIPDVNGDGHEDLFVASNVPGWGYLQFVDGKKGSIINSIRTNYEPNEAIYIGGYICAAKPGGIDVYDISLNKLYTMPASSGVRPKSLQTFNEKDVVFLDDIYVKSYILSLGSEKWSLPAANDLLIINPHRFVLIYANRSWDRWDIKLINDDGKELDHSSLPSKYHDDIRLNHYDHSRFLAHKTNDTTSVIWLIDTTGDVLSLLWEVEVDRYRPLNEGFAIVDTNGDQMKEIIAAWRENITVFDGASGRQLYTTDMYASYINDVAIVSDINGDGINETVICVYHASTTSTYYYLASFKRYTFDVPWKGREGFSRLQTIEDADGDGYQDVVAALSAYYLGSWHLELWCYWGNYDNAEPVIIEMSPMDNAYIPSTNVTLRVKVADSQSGIRDVFIYVRGTRYHATYNPSTDYYEVLMVLSEGSYSWYVDVWDRVDFHSISPYLHFTLDVSPPVLRIYNPIDGAYLNQSMIYVKWSGHDEYTDIGYFAVKLDESGWINVGTNSEYTFTAVNDGEHKIYVKAADILGNENAKSTTVTIDTVSPLIFITTPTPGAFLRGTVDIKVTGDDVNLERIELYIDEHLIKTWGLAGNYAYAWDTTVYDDGSHVIRLKSYDKARNFNENNVSVVTDNTPPKVSIASPSHEEVVRSANVLVTWFGSDGTSGIESYEIRIDGGLWINVGTDTEYTFSRVSDGEHIVRVKALDKVGLAEEDFVSFIVNTSLIGEPGWIDDIMIFGGIGCFIIIAIVVFIARRRK